MSSRTVCHWVVVLCAAALAASCGMRPPPEYHEVSNAETVDLTPMPAPVEDADAGAADVEDGDESPDGPGMGTLSIGLPLAAMPAITIAQVLGMARKDVEALQSPAKPETPEQKAEAKRDAKEGWVRLTSNLKVQFDDADVAIAFEQQVPAGLSCLDAAKWLGFADAAPPVDTPELCKWTDDKGDANLGGGAHGELDRKTSLFTAKKPAPQKTP
jgi:hypothetical protein